jgi:hypothetical protein
VAQRGFSWDFCAVLSPLTPWNCQQDVNLSKLFSCSPLCQTLRWWCTLITHISNICGQILW